VQRFLTDFLRAFDRTVWGLTGAQFVCLGMIAAGLVIAVRLVRRRASAPAVAPEPAT
jgi:hypothetical protein